MTKPTRILIGAVVCFLIMIAGLLLGFIASKHNFLSGSAQKSNTASKPAPNFNTYEISPPSRATINQTKSVNISPLGPVAFVMLDKSEAGDIKTGQRILLYDDSGTLLETLGEVSEIKAGSDMLADKVTVHMKLNGDEKVDTSKAVRGEIIISRIPDSARLPLSALIRNEKDETYTWEAVANSDGTTSAYYKRINVAVTTYDYFVIEQNSFSGAIYVLNPDKALQDGQKINVKKILYAGPAQTDESRISELMKRRRFERDAMAAQQAALQAPSGANVQTGAAGANACAPLPNAAAQFMRDVKDLAPAATQSTPSAQ